MNDSCLFCAHLNTLEIVFEDDRVAVALHEDWAVRGHAMVIWKGHVENVSQLNDAEITHFWRVYRDAERAILELARADRAIMMKLGIATPHLHLHIYPVSSALDRSAVASIIDGLTRVPRDETFVLALRKGFHHRGTEDTETSL